MTGKHQNFNICSLCVVSIPKFSTIGQAFLHRIGFCLVDAFCRRNSPLTIARILALIPLISFATLACPQAGNVNSSTPKTPTIDPTRMIRVGKRQVELPPTTIGCYRHTNGKWVEANCLTPEEKLKIPRLSFRSDSVIQSPSSSPIGTVGAAGVQLDFLRFGSESDASHGGSNQFSIQLNSNVFNGNNGHADWVQFTYQRELIAGSQLSVMCIWNIDLTVPNLGGYSPDGCMHIDVDRAPAVGDSAALAGTGFSGIFDSTGLTKSGINGVLQAVATLPWASGGNDPNEMNLTGDVFAISAPDTYGLMGGKNWQNLDAGMLGAAVGSHATFNKACVTTSVDIDFSNINNPNLAPQTPVLAPGSSPFTTTTAETNNLVLVNSPVPNCVWGAPPGLNSPGMEGCVAAFDNVSQDWVHQGTSECYSKDVPQAALPSTSQVFEDDSTQATVGGVTAHICRGGTWLIGLDADNNRFLCSASAPGSSPSSWVADTSTHKTMKYKNEEISVHV